MPVIRFNEKKNILLKVTRGINFEDILEAIEKGGLLDDIAHPSKKYPHQRVFVVKRKGYVYAVPYVKDTEGVIFLKTVHASRVFTKSYLKSKN